MGAATDKDIQTSIQGYLSRASGGNVTDKLDDAWFTVNAQRLQGDCGALIAIVEHYLFCRSLTAKYAPLTAFNPIFYAFATVYDIAKAINEAGLLPTGYKEGTCPQSHTSKLDNDWTITGVWDGVQDFTGVTTMQKLVDSVAAHPYKGM